MKQILYAGPLILASFLIAAEAEAQTLNVDCGTIIYSFPAEETGVMDFEGGKTLTIAGQTFEIDDIASIFVTDDEAEDNLVRIEYSEDSAKIYVSYDLLPYVEASASGAHVSIVQSDEVGEDTTGEITYRLSGESSDGSFSMTGSYKCSLELTGVTLTNPSGPAFDIQNGKRIAVRVAADTVNSLTDGEDGDWKGCFVCKGHPEFKQKGTLNITSNTGHGIYSKEYIEIKNTVINILGAKKDGINCAQYFLMESGGLTINKVGDDGIQLAYKDANVTDDEEDTGLLTIQGGKLNISVTADAAKALRTEGDFLMTDGEITVLSTSEGLWDDSKNKTKASACIAADKNVVIEGGILNLTATGGGGKGINADESLTVSGGEIRILTTGGMLAYVNGSLDQNYTGNTDRLDSDYKSAPKGIKAQGNIEIEDGILDIRCEGFGGEGIESKAELTVSGGQIKVRAYDDGTNSANDSYFKGGELDIMSIGNGDGIDSNGNIYVSGGRLMVFGARQPEQGFDAGDGGQIYFTGGEILAVGGGNSVPTNSTLSTQAYLELNNTVSAGDKIMVASEGDTIVEFTVPEDYNPQGGFGNGGGWWAPPAPAPGGGWGGMGSGLVISAPDLTDGQTYDVAIGDTTTTATAKLSK